MSPRTTRVLSLLAVAAVAIPATAHTIHTQREAKKGERALAALFAGIAPLAKGGAGMHKVTLNGSPVFFETKTETRPIDEVMSQIAKDCASGDHDVALGAPASLEDGQSRGLVLERITNQESAAGVRASLCIFTREETDDGSLVGTPKERLRRARYTLAHQREDGTTSVTTIVNASGTPLADLFPAEGDAPGSDIEGIARPIASRRTLTAVVGDELHSARIYESTLPIERSVETYDAAMTQFGYQTTAALPEARMYRKNGVSFVASFQATTEGSTVTIAPFEPEPAVPQIASY